MRHERFGLLCVSVPVFLSKPVVRGNGKAVATLAGTFMGGGLFRLCPHRSAPFQRQVYPLRGTGVRVRKHRHAGLGLSEEAGCPFLMPRTIRKDVSPAWRKPGGPYSLRAQGPKEEKALGQRADKILKKEKLKQAFSVICPLCLIFVAYLIV